MDELSVGEVARIFGISVRTLHHYDEVGLLVPQARSLAGYRLYSAADLERLATIVTYRRLGMPLDAIGEILAGDERVLAEPAPVIFVRSLDESGVSFAVRPWVSSEDYWKFQWDLPERVKLRFDAEGITIPFPQRDVHLHGGR